MLKVSRAPWLTYLKDVYLCLTISDNYTDKVLSHTKECPIYILCNKQRKPRPTFVKCLMEGRLQCVCMFCTRLLLTLCGDWYFKSHVEIEFPSWDHKCLNWIVLSSQCCCLVLSCACECERAQVHMPNVICKPVNSLACSLISFQTKYIFY